ncbi:unnamed protein product [Heligmosomoides polygyrus]|uniref:Uncharacterized protein n=1 Tax=Heligmosomoides polygyrus TaxID=6339 RepID=A0A183G035_HELPZ|nr:unnamed protein product [Heligmosomoides polygyrus]
MVIPRRSGIKHSVVYMHNTKSAPRGSKRLPILAMVFSDSVGTFRHGALKPHPELICRLGWLAALRGARVSIAAGRPWIPHRERRPMESPSSSARSPEDELIFEKSAKVKQWVKNRMKEVMTQLLKLCRVYSESRFWVRIKHTTPF